ncbi:hypothetical protein ACFL4G_00865 [Thermodesulfobacteriota bacterium]
MKVHKFLGFGSEKEVFKIWKQNKILKVFIKDKIGMRHLLREALPETIFRDIDLGLIPSPGDRNALLEEVKGERILRDLNIDFAPCYRYDPEGNWIIKEFVSKPTVRFLIESGSQISFQEPLISAFFALIEKLRSAECEMDMDPGNWVLKYRDEGAYLLSLEPSVLKSNGQHKRPSVESTALPTWLGHRPSYRISASQLSALKRNWETEEKYIYWRKYFGPTFPQLSSYWEISQD